MSRPLPTLVAIAVAAALAGAPAIAALPTRPVLSLAAAQKMVDGCVAFAQANRLRVAVVVKDAGDAVIASARMDGAAIATYDGALLKSSSSARIGVPTSLLAKFGFDEKTGQPTASAFTPGVVLFAGGLPVKAGDATVGAIGVSGAMPGDDERCAQAGLDAAAADLR